MTLLDDLCTHRPSEILFWSGAGVSVPAPTFGPAGAALTHRALAGYFLPEVAGTLTALYRDLGVANPAARPRLETVLEALHETYASMGLSDCLSDLATAPPNRHHFWFAHHVSLGGGHVTANFDRCIERAAASLGDSATPIHIHGALDENVTLLGARLAVIRRGLADGVVQRLDAAIAASGVLVFVGYSGSDYFDVDPFLRSRAELLSARAVVWHDFQPGGTLQAEPRTEADPDFPRFLRGTRAKVVVTRGELDHLLAQLGGSWPCAGDSPVECMAPPMLGRPAWRQQLAASSRERAAATLGVYSRMGYWRGVLEVAAQQPPRGSRDLDRLAAAQWAAGRYREAGATWNRAYSGVDAADCARRAERAGAVLWVRGRLLAAQRHLWQSICCFGAHEEVPLDVRLTLLETYARVVVHMRRMPDTRFLVHRRRAAAVLQLIAAARNGRPVEDELAPRLDSVTADLTGGAYLQAEDHLEDFVQSESLSSWLNYRHAALRRQARAYSNDKADGCPVRATILELAEAQHLIGADGDAPRTHLLPGAWRYATARQVWTAFADVDVTPYHRVRLVAGIALARTNERVRRMRLRLGKARSGAIS